MGFDAIIGKENSKIINANQNEPNTVNSEKTSKQIVNAPLVASKSGKGLFHPVKTKNAVNNASGLSTFFGHASHDHFKANFTPLFSVFMFTIDGLIDFK